MNKFITVKIKCWGIVQGVGFRPFVVKLATKMNMNGEVLNIGGLVEIQVTDTTERIDSFVEALQREKPLPAEIVHLHREIIADRIFEGFAILDSDAGDDETAMIPADLALCPECERELNDPENPRFQHPFISCMVCGPRYTIIDRIPYDRENTRMIDFPMCEFCHGEYTAREDRRYHAQTISCHECGPQLIFVDAQGCTLEGLEEVLREAAQRLKDGQILAFKGVGGYNLVCNPLDNEASRRLRKLKGREEKPFAILFPDIEGIKEACMVSPEEERLLQSSARPILLLEKGKNARINGIPLDKVFLEFNKSRFIGSFLPSMGAQHLLLDRFGGPLIMTSANVSGMPMIIDDEEMMSFMQKSDGILSGILMNRREINVRVDDSVARVMDGHPQMIRRSKGYVPVPLHVNVFSGEARSFGKENMILAMGGQLKNSFALSKGSFSYVSQYFGDLDSLENCTLHQETVERMKSLFRIRPSLVVGDMHPGYASTRMGRDYAEKHGLPFLPVQHHHAHVASVMAEHALNEPVIGISLDGTGYGTDGKIWGGEILLCHRDKCTRLAHLKYIKMIGGDSSMKEAWKSAMCYLYDSHLGSNLDLESTSDLELKSTEKPEEGASFTIDIRDIIADTELEKDANWPMVRAALEHEVNTLESASMGRLFDAVSSLLGICHFNEYEGQCAMLLEDAAARAMEQCPATPADDAALQFHYRVADAVVQQCVVFREKTKVNKVALTGGVFQNKILMERCLELLRALDFQVYYNISVSPNDGGIALGQNYVGMHYLANQTSSKAF